MKKIIIFVIIMLITSSLTFAGIGANFKKGGIGIGGSVSLYCNLYQILDDWDERMRLIIELYPELQFFIKDNLSIFFGPFFSFTYYQYDSFDSYQYSDFGAYVGFEHAFVSNPDAETGTVPALGAAVQLSAYKEGLYLNTLLTLSPRLLFYFFVNDSLAPYFSINPSLRYLLTARDFDGNSIIDMYEFSNRLHFYFRIMFGITYHIPTEKASIF